MLDESLQGYNTFSIYWPSVQFSMPLGRPHHPPEVKSTLFSFLQKHFLVYYLSFLYRTSTFSNYIQKPTFETIIENIYISSSGTIRLLTEADVICQVAHKSILLLGYLRSAKLRFHVKPSTSLYNHFLAQTKDCFIPCLKRSHLLPGQLPGKYTGQNYSGTFNTRFSSHHHLPLNTCIQVYRQKSCSWTHCNSLHVLFIVHPSHRDDSKHPSLNNYRSSDTSCICSYH